MYGSGATEGGAMMAQAQRLSGGVESSRRGSVRANLNELTAQMETIEKSVAELIGRLGPVLQLGPNQISGNKDAPRVVPPCPISGELSDVLECQHRIFARLQDAMDRLEL